MPACRPGLGGPGSPDRAADCTQGVPGPAAGAGARSGCQAPLTTIPLLPVDMVTTSTSPAPEATPVAAEPTSYEEALAELERLVLAMEAGQLPLERMLGSYQRGAQLLRYCRARLEAVEEQVRVLEDGQLQPWTEDA